MTKYSGYMGKLLMIDLSEGSEKEYPWTDRDRELYIGGKAAASKIMYDNFTGKEDPFSGDNLIIVSTGPVTGTFAPSSNRFDISSLSPLTGLTTSSNCGGDFGFYLKKAGLDALKPGGVLAAVLYSGKVIGNAEKKAAAKFFRSLPLADYTVLICEFANWADTAPLPCFVIKREK